MLPILIIAAVALVAAGAGQVQNHFLRHRVAGLEVTHRRITAQQRRQADRDLASLGLTFARQAVAADLTDGDVGDVISAAEDLLRREDGAE